MRHIKQYLWSVFYFFLIGLLQIFVGFICGKAVNLSGDLFQIAGVFLSGALGVYLGYKLWSMWEINNTYMRLLDKVVLAYVVVNPIICAGLTFIGGI